jgi:multidrug efflux pump subunit AcrA (membrane-fusion protein)
MQKEMRSIPPFFGAALMAFTACRQPHTAQPQHRPIVDAVFASGRTEAKSQYRVTAYADGYLQDSYVSEDDSVHKGQLLFRIAGDIQHTQVENAASNYQYALRNASDQGPQIQQLLAQIAQAQQKKTTDSLNFLRYQRLLPTHAVSQVDYDNARLVAQASTSSLTVLQKNLEDLRTNLSQNTENTREQYRIQQQSNDYYRLQSETDGRILNVYKKNGDLVRKGDVVADLGAGRLIAKLFIAEEDIRRIVLGQQVLISLNTEKEHIHRATITKIYPSFDTSEQAFIAEASFDEMPPGLKNATQLQANIIIAEKKEALVIPSACLLPGDSVIIAKDDARKRVTTGIKTLEWIEVLDGLDSNARIKYLNIGK